MGGMRACPKEGAQWWLTEHGFAMASIEARVSAEVIAPAQVHDCKAAVRWLRSHAVQYGYSPDAIGVWGHSAGGLLAALLGTSGDLAELEGDGNAGVSSRVQAVCDECGAPHDFSWFARPDIKTRFAPVAENLRLYLGGPVEERQELARFVSPQTYVSNNCPPMLLIHGDKDDVVPVEETINFHQVLKSAGVDSTLRILPGIGHGWDASLTKLDILAFFERILQKRN
jgi:acetyl esterase/lipase